MGGTRRKTDMAKFSTPPGAWQVLFVDGKLVGPVKIGQTVRVYPDIDLPDLAGLHRKQFKTVDDMLAAVKSLLPNAKRLETRGDQAAIGELFALLVSKRAILDCSSTISCSDKRTVKASTTKQRT